MNMVERIEKIINDWLLFHEFEATAEVALDFEYVYTDSLIRVSFFSSRDDNLFRDYFYELGLRYDVDIFLMAFLHELGHAETIEDISESDYQYSIKQKEEISNHYYSDELVRQYQRLPDEHAASAWAVNYINSHAEELALWWNEVLRPEIMKFYDENGLTN